MQITALLATLLLAAPAIVSAAPVVSDNAVSAVAGIFARDNPTCNPVFSSDPATKAKQQEALQRMKDLTKEYHAAEQRCPSSAVTTFQKKGGDKNAKEALKKKCVDAYAEYVPTSLMCHKIWQLMTFNRCATKRELANKACISAGGKSDAGHQQAVQFCKTKATEWRARKVQ